jgi:hypothetical protein
VPGRNALVKFTDIHYAGFPQELYRWPRITLNAGAAVAEEATGITELSYPKLNTDELCEALKNKSNTKKGILRKSG